MSAVTSQAGSCARNLRLDQVAKVVGGATPKTGNSSFWDGPIAWATPKDLSTLSSSRIERTARTITPEGLKSCAAEVLPVGSVLFSSRAPIGLTAINTVPMATNQGFKSLIPIEDVCFSGYLYHWLRANRAYLDSLGNGATFKEVSKAIVSRVEIPIPHKNSKPDLEEQKRIAAILDKADAIRRKRQQALRLTDDFLRSLFLDMFGDPVTNPKGWEVRPLKCVVGSSFRNGLSPSNRGSVDGKVLTLSAITSGKFRPTEMKSAMFDRVPSENQRVTCKTFLICRGNGNLRLVGTGVFPTEEMPDITFPDTMIAATIDRTKVEPSYLQSVWSSPHVRQQIERGARTTNGTHKVNQSVLGNIEIPLPDLTLQAEYAEVVRRVSSKRQKAEALEKESEALFSSLQQRAFRGEL